MSKLSKEFYQREDVLTISKELLGKVLCTNFGNLFTAGIIVETEAYAGITDKASHTYGGKHTKRTKIMYAPGGIAYIYLCYGIHHLFNVITNIQDVPHAVLIRAIEPLEGIDIMLRRRKMVKPLLGLSAGPGMLSQALGIAIENSGVSLLENKIWIEDNGKNHSIDSFKIISSPRVGIQYAGHDSLNPWRFRMRGNPWVSSAP